ncbi:hypothetical protein NFI96_003331 [Prochilodus magdalenae]|nr:hypothetical protein NFI96_003331 [Prochilodus magdalenae]
MISEGDTMDSECKYKVYRTGYPSTKVQQRCLCGGGLYGCRFRLLSAVIYVYSSSMRTQDRLPFRWFCLQVLFATALSDVWKAEVTDKVNALVSSCVVMPCKFNYPGTPLPDSRIRGIWHKKDKKENIYHEDQTEVADSFKERTKLLGATGYGSVIAYH